MQDRPVSSGRMENIFRNSSLGLVNNVLPSILRFFSRYVFFVTFGDTLLGVNSLFSDVVMLFSFAEMGIYSAISFFLYKPIAEKDTDKIQSFLSLYRKINIVIMVLMGIVGVGFIPFLKMIKTDEPIPGLAMYYLIFLAQNILSYVLSYRSVYITAMQKAYQIAYISIAISIATVVLQILVTLTTKNFAAYLLVGLALFGVQTLWTNRYIVTHYPETRFARAKPLDAEARKQFAKKTKSLFIVKIANLGISQTDSLIVSMMVNVVQWGYVSNYLAVKKIATMALSAFSLSVLPSLGNLTATENQEKQRDTFQFYNFFNAWLYLNFFAGFVILVPPFISLVFGVTRVLDDLTCFLLFFNVLYVGLLEPVTILRDAQGLYEFDQWLTVVAFVCNLIASIAFVSWIGLPGVFIGGLVCTTVMYGRPYLIWHEIFGGKGGQYYGAAAKTILQAMIAYGILQCLVHPVIWGWQSNFGGLMLSAAATVLVTNLVFVLTSLKNPYFHRSLQLAGSILGKRLRCPSQREDLPGKEEQDGSKPIC